MKNIISTILVLMFISVTAFSQDKQKEKKTDYKPKINGTIRTKYEYQPQISSGRFQVRNARFSFTGNMHKMISYKLEADLSDQGKMRMLDAFARIDPLKGLFFKMGQMRVPFSIDPQRSPHTQYFANRSFLAKQIGDVRDVGASAGYDFRTMGKPIIIEAGLYNGNGILEQKEWTKDINYSAKAQFFPVKGFNVTLSSMRTSPDKYYVYIHGIGSFLDIKNLHIESEYMFKHYQNKMYKEVHTFNGFINYDIPLKKVFSKISVLGRYDFMTDHWDGSTYEIKTDEHNNEIMNINTTEYKRHRITAGTTLSIAKKPFTADLRLNYEKYLYDKDAIIDPSEKDKIVIELMIRF